MDKSKAEEIAALMGSGQEIQVVQTAFRLALVQAWQIPSGAKVLEIGCGQGDMTAVLADAVGPAGSILAVDIADPSYGTPLSLGQSSDILLQSSLGERIEFKFKFDVLDPAHTFPDVAFDFVVLAHSSWYFQSLDQLRQLLARVRPWAKQLCFSEWDLELTDLRQAAHLLAVLIQGQVESYRRSSHANVRTPFSQTCLLALLKETSWTPASISAVDSSKLQDGGWEMDMTLASSLREAAALEIPEKLRDLIRSQIDVLTALSQRREGRQSLPSYAIRAV